MGKFKTWKHRSLFTNIATSCCLVGATAGIVFGVSAGTFKVNYVNLDTSAKRAAAANGAFSYYSQNITSKWNMVDGWNPESQTVDGAVWKQGKLWEQDKTWWKELHNNAATLKGDEAKLELKKNFGEEYDNPSQAKKARYDYMSMVIDGSTHSTMDRSFNQGLYNGIVNFIQNKLINGNDLKPENGDANDNSARSYRPGGDQTTSFTEIYASMAKTSKAIGLAGFNHVTPLTTLGVYGNGEKGDKFDGGAATNYRFKYNDNVYDGTGFLLIDGEIANNQNLSSVLFRSDQPGFLSAMSTCMYFMNNLDTYHAGNKDISVGAYGGTSIPTVTIYMGGFERGVEFFNKFVLAEGILAEGKGYIQNKSIPAGTIFESIYKNSKYKEEIDKQLQASTPEELNNLMKKLYDEYSIKVVKLGAEATHFTGNFASGDAIGITKQLLNRGVSAIIAVAGPQSLDSAQEILNQKSKCIVVGVDSSMEDGDYQRPMPKKSFHDKSKAPDGSTPAQTENIIKFSAVKDMTTVTERFAELCANGYNYDVEDPTKPGQPDPAKAICGIGYKTCGNIQNGLISISFDGWVPLMKGLSYVKFADKTSGTVLSFTDVWNKAVDLEKAELEEKWPTALDEVIKDLNQVVTYKKDTPIYKNYSVVTKILGKVLSEFNVTIPAWMNVKETEQPDPKDPSKKITVYVEETEDKNLDVLAWLQGNMYFSC